MRKASSTLSTKVDKSPPRMRRTNSQVETMREQLLAILREDHPQSVRHVYYRMTDPRLPCAVEKTERCYKHVQYQLSEMRKRGLLRYGWISDATRTGYFVDTFDDAADFLRRVSSLYRSDAWKWADHYVEVWAESRSIASVIRDTCEDLGVSLYPAGGFSSLTLSYEAAAYINARVEGTGKSIEIIYIGDYDPAGVLLDRDIEAKLRGHLKIVNPMTFHRIAINEEQIGRLNLPTKPRKQSDKRALNVKETVEAEAMPAAMLRQLLRDKIELFLPENALHAARVAEESERRGLRLLANTLEAR